MPGHKSWLLLTCRELPSVCVFFEGTFCWSQRETKRSTCSSCFVATSSWCVANMFAKVFVCSCAGPHKLASTHLPRVTKCVCVFLFLRVFVWFQRATKRNHFSSFFGGVDMFEGTSFSRFKGKPRGTPPFISFTIISFFFLGGVPNKGHTQTCPPYSLTWHLTRGRLRKSIFQLPSHKCCASGNAKWNPTTSQAAAMCCSSCVPCHVGPQVITVRQSLVHKELL